MQGAKTALKQGRKQTNRRENSCMSMSSSACGACCFVGGFACADTCMSNELGGVCVWGGGGGGSCPLLLM